MRKSLHTPEYKFFCTLLVEARERKSISQAEVALALQKPQSFVSKYESGERRIDMLEFIQICKILGVNPTDIVSEVAEKLLG